MRKKFTVKSRNSWDSKVLYETNDKSEAISFAIKESKKSSKEIYVAKDRFITNDIIWSSKD